MHIVKKTFVTSLKPDQKTRFNDLLKTFKEKGFTILLGEFEIPEGTIGITRKFYSLNIFKENVKIQEYKRDAKEPGTVLDAMASFLNDFEFFV